MQVNLLREGAEAGEALLQAEVVVEEGEEGPHHQEEEEAGEEGEGEEHLLAAGVAEEGVQKVPPVVPEVEEEQLGLDLEVQAGEEVQHSVEQVVQVVEEGHDLHEQAEVVVVQAHLAQNELGEPVVVQREGTVLLLEVQVGAVAVVALEVVVEVQQVEESGQEFHAVVEELKHGFAKEAEVVSSSTCLHRSEHP